jgi:hypothetical protein
MLPTQLQAPVLELVLEKSAPTLVPAPFQSRLLAVIYIYIYIYIYICIPEILKFIHADPDK